MMFKAEIDNLEGRLMMRAAGFAEKGLGAGAEGGLCECLGT